MKINRVPLFFMICFIASCTLTEEQRLISNAERDFKIKFTSSPTLLKTEEFGSLHDGGDRSILQLSKTDCSRIMKKLNNTGESANLVDFQQMLAVRNIESGELKYSNISVLSGHYLVYAIDVKSCVLYRVAQYD